MATAFTLKSIFEAVDRISGPVKTMRGNVFKFSKETEDVFKKVGTAAKRMGIAVAAGTVALGKAMISFAEKGDEIAKTSRMLGLSTDALQELRYAAGLQGVENEMLTQGLKLFNNQLGQLRLREGSLYTMLAKTNPALARQLRDAKSTDEAFTLMMTALAAETNVQRRAAIAQAAFGKSGQELIKFSNGGADALATLRAEAHKYGIVIDEQAAEASERFDDSVSRLKQSFISLANQGLGQAIDKLQPLVQKYADWVAANKEAISLKLDSFIDGVGKGLKVLTSPGVLKGIVSLALGIKAIGLASMVLGAGNPLVLLIGGLVGLITLIVTNWDKITGFFQRLTGGKGSMGGMSQYDGQRQSTSPQLDQANALAASMGYPVSPNLGAIAATSSSTTSRAIVDINLPNLPEGTRVKQRGAAPGVTLATGRQMSGGVH